MYIGIMISLVILGVVIAYLETKGLSTFHPAPLGYHELLGGLIFGLGMVMLAVTVKRLPGTAKKPQATAPSLDTSNPLRWK